jgi:hypothetical protein
MDAGGLRPSVKGFTEAGERHDGRPARSFPEDEIQFRNKQIMVAQAQDPFVMTKFRPFQKILQNDRKKTLRNSTFGVRNSIFVFLFPS